MTGERFWAQVDATGDCWDWLGYSKRGYGYFGGRPAHRVVYEMLVGTIPDGLTIDHLCRNRQCVNPDHLEVVSTAVNTLRGFNPAAINKRKTTCMRGHSDWRLVPSRPGKRLCRGCERIANATRPGRYLNASGTRYDAGFRASPAEGSPRSAFPLRGRVVEPSAGVRERVTRHVAG